MVKRSGGREKGGARKKKSMEEGEERAIIAGRKKNNRSIDLKGGAERESTKKTIVGLGHPVRGRENGRGREKVPLKQVGGILKDSSQWRRPDRKTKNFTPSQ